MTDQLTATLPICFACDRPMRPRNTDRHLFPGSVQIGARGACGVCFNRHARHGYWEPKPADDAKPVSRKHRRTPAPKRVPFVHTVHLVRYVNTAQGLMPERVHGPYGGGDRSQVIVNGISYPRSEWQEYEL